MYGWFELQVALLPWYPWVDLLVLALAASCAHLAVRQQYAKVAGAVWTVAWVLLVAGRLLMDYPSFSLISSAISAAIAVTVAVVTAMLVIPWREQIARDWSWPRMAWWFARAAFGVGIAYLLMLALIYVAFAMGRIG